MGDSGGTERSADQENIRKTMIRLRIAKKLEGMKIDVGERNLRSIHTKLRKKLPQPTACRHPGVRPCEDDCCKNKKIRLSKPDSNGKPNRKTVVEEIIEACIQENLQTMDLLYEYIGLITAPPSVPQPEIIQEPELSSNPSSTVRLPKNSQEKSKAKKSKKRKKPIVQHDFRDNQTVPNSPESLRRRSSTIEVSDDDDTPTSTKKKKVDSSEKNQSFGQ